MLFYILAFPYKFLAFSLKIFKGLAILSLRLILINKELIIKDSLIFIIIIL